MGRLVEFAKANAEALESLHAKCDIGIWVSFSDDEGQVGSISTIEPSRALATYTSHCMSHRLI